MSDDHDALAREQEREADALAKQSDALGERVDGVKDDLKQMESSESIATPDASIEDVERRPGAGAEGPTQPPAAERAPDED